MTIQRLREGRSTASQAERRDSFMSSYPNGWGWSNPAAIPPPGLGIQRAGVPVTAHTSLQVDSVFTSLRVISNAFIKMGNPRAYIEQLTKDNEPYRVWQAKQPPLLANTFGLPTRGFTPENGRIWQYDGFRRTIISLGLFGESFWLTLTRDDLGFPTMLEVLHPAFVSVEPIKVGPKKGLQQYYYGSGINKTPLKTEDVSWFPFMAFPGAARGLSSIEYMGISYALALAAMEFGQRWFSQGAAPSYILSTDQKLGQEEVERIARKFLIEHSGLQSAHLPLVLDSGVKASKVMSTPDEAQYLNTLEYARSCIAAWFGLPPHLVGGANDKGNVWGRTVQEQGFQLQDYTMPGYIVPISEVLTSLIPSPQMVAFDDSIIARADAENMAKLIVAKRTAGSETQNEIRVHDHRRAPLPGGDDLFAPLNSNTSPPVGNVFAEEIGDDLGLQAPNPNAESQQDNAARFEQNLHYLVEAVERIMNGRDAISKTS